MVNRWISHRTIWLRRSMQTCQWSWNRWSLSLSLLRGLSSRRNFQKQRKHRNKQFLHQVYFFAFWSEKAPGIGIFIYTFWQMYISFFHITFVDCCRAYIHHVFHVQLQYLQPLKFLIPQLHLLIFPLSNTQAGLELPVTDKPSAIVPSIFCPL